MRRILVSAGEASGDLYASLVVEELRRILPETEFFGCTYLTNAAIGSGVTNIGFGTFAYCTSLATITVDGMNSAYSSAGGVMFTKSQTTLIQYRSEEHTS